MVAFLGSLLYGLRAYRLPKGLGDLTLMGSAKLVARAVLAGMSYRDAAPVISMLVFSSLVFSSDFTLGLAVVARSPREGRRSACFL